MRRLPILALSLVIAAPVWAADDGLATGQPVHEPSMRNVPGALSYAEGMLFYNNGWYFAARHRFLIAAMYGDKVAQYNLGVIFYQGQGLDRDPVRAWAWFDLAAERGYPHMVVTAADVWDDLDEAERLIALDIRESLAERYGDEIVVPRVAARMERDRQRAIRRTGTVGHVAIDFEGRRVSGREFYAAENWDFRRLIQREVELFERLSRGRVEVGEIEVVEDEGR